MELREGPGGQPCPERNRGPALKAERIEGGKDIGKMETVRRGYEPKDVVEFGPGAAEKMNAAAWEIVFLINRLHLCGGPPSAFNAAANGPGADYVHPGRVGGTGAETDDSGAGVPCPGRL